MCNGEGNARSFGGGGGRRRKGAKIVKCTQVYLTMVKFIIIVNKVG